MNRRFVDLFAGLGGFHLALRDLGHQCVFASELDPQLASLYGDNFGIHPAGDIRTIDIPSIPDHEVLCAGPPCQPFSKAGSQHGLSCPQWGNLIDYVIRVLEYHTPTYFVIENVPHLLRHDHGKTWAGIQHRLRNLGYDTQTKVLSPHDLGIPHVRPRTFAVGSLEGLSGFAWPKTDTDHALSISSVLEHNPPDARKLSEAYVKYLKQWQEFLNRFPTDQELPSHPIWAMEFGATYPYQEAAPMATNPAVLRSLKGAFGTPLRGMSRDQVSDALPPYARAAQQLPPWKIRFIRQNRHFYMQHKAWLDQWLQGIRSFAPSFQKFEWNCKGEDRTLWRYIIQFRASGIRVKRPTTSPSLVAMTTSQVPVVGWEQRYMTPRECSRLQCMERLRLPRSDTSAFRALGNAVNVTVVKAVATCLLGVGSIGRQASPRETAA